MDDSLESLPFGPSVKKKFIRWSNFGLGKCNWAWNGRVMSGISKRSKDNQGKLHGACLLSYCPLGTICEERKLSCFWWHHSIRCKWNQSSERPAGTPDMNDWPQFTHDYRTRGWWERLKSTHFLSVPFRRHIWVTFLFLLLFVFPPSPSFSLSVSVTLPLNSCSSRSLRNPYLSISFIPLFFFSIVYTPCSQDRPSYKSIFSRRVRRLIESEPDKNDRNLPRSRRSHTAPLARLLLGRIRRQSNLLFMPHQSCHSHRHAEGINFCSAAQSHGAALQRKTAYLCCKCERTREEEASLTFPSQAFHWCWKCNEKMSLKF